jgi:naphtho-gamma-pyrone polyketide synthase
MTNPDNFAGLDRGHFLSHTGNCNTFDNAADGYCRSECVGSVVMKRLEDAEADGDPIYGTILGTATNHSAESVSITRPHSGAQEAIFKRILNSAGVDQSEVSYIEMHGTGTQHGDAVEMKSVLSVFSPDATPRKQPLHLGSVKSNIGHAESASGVASLVKVLLMMEKSTIPRHVGIKTEINRNFPTDLTQRNVHIAMTAKSWPRDTTNPRKAFINNFSAAGGNSSVLLEDAPVETARTKDPRPLHLITVSAKSATALRNNIASLRTYLDENQHISLGALSYTTTARRIHHNFRLVVSGNAIAGVAQSLKASENKEKFLAISPNPAGMGYCFTGQGSQYLGMGRQLLEIPQFRASMEFLDEIVTSHRFFSVLPVIDGSSTVEMSLLPASTLQLAITCLQMALSKYWKSLGVVPQIAIGHSLGEYAALNACGFLSDSDTIWLVGTRAQLLETHCTAGTHAMLAVNVSTQRLNSYLESQGSLEVACINGPEDTVVSGSKTAIAALANTLAENSIKATELQVQFAFHSSQVEPMLKAFEHAIRSITFKEPSTPIISPLLGRVVTTAADLGSPSTYLSMHCRNTVQFYDALKSASGSDSSFEKLTWLEIGPHPVCSAMLCKTLGSQVKAYPSLRRNEDNWKTLVSTLGAFYEKGVVINWSEYHHAFKKHLKVIRLPAYKWDLKNYWIPYKHDWCLTKGDEPVSLPSAQPLSEESSSQYLSTSVQKIVEETYTSSESSITATSDVNDTHFKQLLEGHKVIGRPLCTSSAYADMALTLFQRLLDRSELSEKSDLGIEIQNMVVTKPLILAGKLSQHIKMIATANWSTKTATWSVCSVSDDGTPTTSYATCSGKYSNRKEWLGEWKRREFLIKSRIDYVQKSVHEDSDSAHLIKSAMFYKLFSALVEYEEGFKGYRELILRSGDHEATGKVKFTAASTESGIWHCNPYWIDSIGQITGFTMNANDSVDSKKTVFLNHGWDNLRISAPLTFEKTYRTYVKMQLKGRNEYSGDVYVLDEQEIMAVYEGVTFTAIERKVVDLAMPLPGGKSQLSKSQPLAQQPMLPKPATEVELPTVKLTHAIAPVPTLEPQLTSHLVVKKIKAIIAEEVGVMVSELIDDEELTSLGVDSLLSLTMADGIREELGVKVDSGIFIDGTTVKGLCDIILQQMPSVEPLTEQLADTPSEGSSGCSTPEATFPNTPSQLEWQPSSQDPLDHLARKIEDMAMGTVVVEDDTEFSFDADKLMVPYKMDTARQSPPLLPATSVLLQGSPRTATKTLWLFPDGSGLASSYLSLPDIDKNTAVFGLNSPYIKRAEQMKCTLRELTTVYLTEIRRRQPHGP